MELAHHWCHEDQWLRMLRLIVVASSMNILRGGKLTYCNRKIHPVAATIDCHITCLWKRLIKYQPEAATYTTASENSVAANKQNRNNQPVWQLWQQAAWCFRENKSNDAMCSAQCWCHCHTSLSNVRGGPPLDVQHQWCCSTHLSYAREGGTTALPASSTH